ncbi:PIG-L family deacetylase [bacterium]|nr:PIG-L family deacetylase [bacterium]
MKTLIIAAHPDDEVLGCGGYIKKYSQEQEIEVLVLTNGCATRYDDQMIQTLQSHAIQANLHLGKHKIYFEDLPNQGLDAIPLSQIIQVIEKHIQRFQPARVLTHHFSDLNLDHQMVYQASITACRPLHGLAVQEIYSYFTASSTEWNQTATSNRFEANWILDITDELSSKLAAMAEYKSEVRAYPHPRSLAAMETYAKYFGISHGLLAAEPYQLIRKIISP